MYTYSIYIYIYIYKLTPIFEGQPSKTRPFPIKIRVIWVLGICIYIYIYIYTWYHRTHHAANHIYIYLHITQLLSHLCFAAVFCRFPESCGHSPASLHPQLVHLKTAGNRDIFIKDLHELGPKSSFSKGLRLFTLQGTNIPSKNGILKMIFLFPRWDMLIPWRVFKKNGWKDDSFPSSKCLFCFQNVKCSSNTHFYPFFGSRGHQPTDTHHFFQGCIFFFRFFLGKTLGTLGNLREEIGESPPDRGVPRLQGLIDSAFVGRCGGSVQLAALAPGTSFLDSLSYLRLGKGPRVWLAKGYMKRDYIQQGI